MNVNERLWNRVNKKLKQNYSAFIDDEFKTIMEEWVASLMQINNYSLHTVVGYLHDSVDFLSFIQKHCSDMNSTVIHHSTLNQLELQDFRSWLAYRIQRGVGHRSNSRAISSIKALFKYLELHHGVKSSKVFAIKMRKKSAALPSVLTEEQALLALTGIISVSKVEWIKWRDLTIMLLLYCCGLRINEAISLQLSNIDFNNSTAIVLGKGARQRMIFLAPIVLEAMNMYLESCPYTAIKSGYIFYGANGKQLNADVYRKIIRNLRSMLSIPQSTSPHTFRHSFATALLDGGIATKTIQQLLGHASIVSTNIYTHVSTKLMIDAYNKFHPDGDDASNQS